MIGHVYTLPSGTELDVASALGDIDRAVGTLEDARDATFADGSYPEVEGAISDLHHVRELLVLLAAESETESIHDLFKVVRAHPDFVFGTIFVTDDVGADFDWGDLHDPKHAEEHMTAAGFEYLENAGLEINLDA